MKLSRLTASVAAMSLLGACSGADNITEAVALTFGQDNKAGDISETFGPATSPKKADGGRVVPAGYGGDYYPYDGNAVYWTSPQGCTYSRTQAPGYEPVWYLVLNPHHIGKPNAHSGCAMRVMEQRG